jgi:hypothetical protein
MSKPANRAVEYIELVRRSACQAEECVFTEVVERLVRGALMAP